MTKLAYIGGGSLFVPSIVNGIARVMLEGSVPFQVELSLYDTVPEKAERMRAYAEIVRGAWDVPLRARVAGSRAEALEGTDVVMVSVWLTEEHARMDRLVAQLGFRLPEEGPGIAGWALACAPWSLGVAAEMRQRCPDALFITLMNPTDVIAGVVGGAGGVRAAGLCVEVDGLRGALAYYFRVPYESIELVHAGVNHDGWVLDLKVDGGDGYALWRERWWEIERDPDYHPGSRGIRHIHDLTGHLRSSGYHNWPYEVEQTPEHQARWDAWRGKQETYEMALDEALRRVEPITDLPGIHPERSKLNYPYTGITVGRLMESAATGRANVIPLQVPNRGAISNFPQDAMVEVPASVQGRIVQPMPVGELPEWLGGYTRLLAIQRRLVVEYVLDRKLATLKQALSVLPMFGTVQQLNRYAELLHKEYS
jgi:alpha-galactosidase/6-phospho-beta-glucosidase family protein